MQDADVTADLVEERFDAEVVHPENRIALAFGVRPSNLYLTGGGCLRNVLIEGDPGVQPDANRCFLGQPKPYG